jgi:hypothetical protein
MHCHKLAINSIGGLLPLLCRTFQFCSSRRMSSCESTALCASDARSVNPVSAKPVPEGFSSVSEGSASIIHETGHVFYNPAQVQNRDLSIACLNVFSKIYRQEKEARSSKRSNRHATEAGAADGRSPVALSSIAAGGDAIPVDASGGEYKGLRILEGTCPSPCSHVFGITHIFPCRVICIWVTFHTLRQRNSRSRFCRCQ